MIDIQQHKKQPRCTCPPGRYSQHCKIKQHRDIAHDINNIFYNDLPHECGWRLTGKIVYVLFAVALLVVICNTVRQVVTSKPPVNEIINRQLDEIEQLKLQNRILKETNEELLGNSIKLPATTTWGKIHIPKEDNK